MSKAVMISIKPKWVGLIASGKKTVEVRKTRPKIDTPFKCYIYCTESGETIRTMPKPFGIDNTICHIMNGKVVGEFVCDICAEFTQDYYELSLAEAASCVPMEDLKEYIGKANGTAWCWHISDLNMYDKPKELGEFRKPCIMPESPYCPCCKVGYEFISEEEGEFYRVDGECNTEWCCLNFIKRPPQSWCYVEELG